MNKNLLQKTKFLLLKKFKLTPQIAIITGSGIELFGGYKPLFWINYSKLPFFAEDTKSRAGEPANQRTGVKGHEGILKLYKIKNKAVLVLSGRRHLYEGYNIFDVILNVRLAYELGIQKIIITNAAGGISKKLKVGDLMLITGFINLIQATERGTLHGIVQAPKKVKSNLTSQLKIKRGIYAGVSGPSYETFSEVNLLQKLGASAIGMSTIPEMICANSLGMDFIAISVISNVWSKGHKPSHKEVLRNVKKGNKKLNDLILGILANI